MRLLILAAMLGPEGRTKGNGTKLVQKEFNYSASSNTKLSSFVTYSAEEVNSWAYLIKATLDVIFGLIPDLFYVFYAPPPSKNEVWLT